MSENTPEELPDPATMPEKHIEIFMVIKLKDGRIIEDYQNGMYGNPDKYDFTDAASVIEYADFVHEKGYDSVYPSVILEPSPDGTMTEVPTEGPMVIPWHEISSFHEKTRIRDFETEQEIRSGLHNRMMDELQEAARQAEAEERAKGVPSSPVVPESGEGPETIHVNYLMEPQRTEVGNGKFGVSLPVVLMDGTRKTIRLDPETAHALGHFLLDGPQGH